jgi:hypothetical protein
MQSIGLDKPLDFQEDEASRISKKSAYEGGKVISLATVLSLSLRRYPWCSFLLETESISGTYWADRIKIKKNPCNLIGNRIYDPPVCSAVPRPTALLRTPL